MRRTVSKGYRDAHGDHDLPRAISWSPEVEIVVPADDLREPVPRTEEVEGPSLTEVAGEDAALLPFVLGEGVVDAGDGFGQILPALSEGEGLRYLRRFAGL